MLELTNLSILLIVNAVFAHPITTGIFQFLKTIGYEIEPQKKVWQYGSYF